MQLLSPQEVSPQEAAKTDLNFWKRQCAPHARNAAIEAMRRTSFHLTFNPALNRPYFRFLLVEALSLLECEFERYHRERELAILLRLIDEAQWLYELLGDSPVDKVPENTLQNNPLSPLRLLPFEADSIKDAMLKESLLHFADLYVSFPYLLLCLRQERPATCAASTIAFIEKLCWGEIQVSQGVVCIIPTETVCRARQWHTCYTQAIARTFSITGSKVSDSAMRGAADQATSSNKSSLTLSCEKVWIDKHSIELEAINFVLAFLENHFAKI